MPGYRDAKVYPLERPNLAQARALAKGHLRGGKATLYVSNLPQPLAVAQTVKRQLAEIGLDVELNPLPTAPLGRAVRTPGEPWDMTIGLWQPDYGDPFQFVNVLFDPRYVEVGNFGSFNSRAYTARMRRAGHLQGDERYRAYGDLDVALARGAAPSAPITFFNEATLVSDRVGCIVLRPTLDLTASCLK